jgi:hypothetical protein
VLATGGHITIGPYDYHLDQAVEGHYRHNFDSLLAQRLDASGRPGAQNLDPTIMPWIYTDWSGGEGNVFYDVRDNTTFDYGTCNPRLPGKIKGPPARTDATLTTAYDSSSFAYLLNAGGKVWAIGQRRAEYSADGTTWTEQAGNPAPTAQQAVGATHDQAKVYVGTTDGTTRLIWRFDADGSDGSWTEVATAVGITAYGMACLQQYLYIWNGDKLQRTDITAGTPWTFTTVYDQGNTPIASVLYRDAISTENKIFMLVGYNGQAEIHQFDPFSGSGVGTKVWPLPPGFTGTCFGQSLGVIYVAGTYNNKAALWGRSLVSGQALFLGYIRADSTLIPRFIRAGQGAQVLIGMQSGEVFIYDAEENAFSFLGSRTIADHYLVAVKSFRDKRIALFANSTGSDQLKASAWNSDEDATTESWEVVSPAWDYDIPLQNKQLHGWDERFKPILGAETLTFSYQLDETGTYTALDQITSATSGASNGRVRQQVSTSSATKTFGLLRTKVNGTLGAELYTSTPLSYVSDYAETWDLVLKVKDETSTQRIANRQARGSELIDFLIDTANNKAVVTFVDGYRYAKGPNPATQSSSHTVVIEEPRIILSGPGEGSVSVRLRNVAVN